MTVLKPREINYPKSVHLILSTKCLLLPKDLFIFSLLRLLLGPPSPLALGRRPCPFRLREHSLQIQTPSSSHLQIFLLPPCSLISQRRKPLCPLILAKGYSLYLDAGFHRDPPLCGTPFLSASRGLVFLRSSLLTFRNVHLSLIQQNSFPGPRTPLSASPLQIFLLCLPSPPS